MLQRTMTDPNEKTQQKPDETDDEKALDNEHDAEPVVERDEVGPESDEPDVA